MDRASLKDSTTTLPIAKGVVGIQYSLFLKAQFIDHSSSYKDWCYLYNLSYVDNPVKMLCVQYRMLPEICYFPSTHFYSNRLETDRFTTLKISAYIS